MISVGAQRQLDALLTSQPESGPWLRLVSEALAEAARPVWEQAAAGLRLRAEQAGRLPLLTGAVVAVDRPAVDAWVRRLLVLAENAGPAAVGLGEVAGAGHLDTAALLAAAINQDRERMATSASALGVDPDALSAVAHLAATPLLLASRRRLAGGVAFDWAEGFCPICGAWPSLAESRGLERARRLRCGRCGGDWAMLGARCAYCGTTDHADLGSLVSETEGEARKVETCARCHGYLKTVATLRAWDGDEVALADLATVDLDLVALERAYRRPERPAVALDLRLVDGPAEDGAA